MRRTSIEHLLRHRPVEAMPVDTQLTGALSVYDLAVGRRDLLPSPAQATAAIQEVERRYPDPATLQRDVEGWYRV
jgi:hypothetical protein